ncbi:DNA-binding response OmpR family regulator [Luteococcus japonicus]|uniref:DNA-binding response OmpR family regulator n=2 Tax=Luteococcus TaxID=33983 RepID=A0A3N1ZXT8_9ACTN|nr:response regulator transcription factor [Luteococcus japonicus]ROR55307.1 DNA-binding response OmpR family regulator [Luteococcus japonicus]
MTDPQPIRVLVVEDEPVLRGTVVNYLERAGLTCRGIADGLEAVDTARDWQPEVVVLDLGLPGLDGIEVCRRIRTFSDCYVLMLTARAEELDTLVGLSVGADDYMTKPFSARELVARVQVLLRRPRRDAPHAAPTRWVFGDLVVLPDSREALVDGNPVDLTRTEFDLLQALARRPRTVLTRHQLTTEVWGGDRGGDDHLVDVHVANLRRKLGDDPASPRYITTVRGVGHRMGSGS